MTTKTPAFKTLEWTGRSLRLLDQTLLPGRTRYITIRNEEELWDAIKRLVVRGAPAIGVAAGWGVYLGTRRRKPSSLAELKAVAGEVADYLATSRPTAVNLFWALEECRRAINGLGESESVRVGLQCLHDTALFIQRDDERRCAAIARHGAPLPKGAKGVLTHCSAGAPATAGVGTAVGVILRAASTRRLTVYVDETRPLLQGARLTAWELKNAGVDYRLITDSMAASAMQRGLVQAIVTGADRIAANGDSANKIGTMPLAICAKHFGIPFHIAAPISTIDFSLKSGEAIPIEERADEEVTGFGGTSTAPKGTRTFNPAFDVVSAKLISAIITEKGVVRAPYRKNLSALRPKTGGGNK